MLKIVNEYYENNEKIYNIRNINLSNKSDLRNIGEYITESRKDSKNKGVSDDYLISGVYIYKSNYDSKKALRIYKDFVDYKYIKHDDAKIVSELQGIQKNIKLTDFPTGIITLEDSVIGQEIIFYNDYKTLSEYIKELKEIKQLMYYYKQILYILEELSKNNIIYKDLHTKNFLVNDNSIKLIDFESSSFTFDKSQKTYIDMVCKTKALFNEINEILKINFKLEDGQTLSELEKEIKIKSKKL